MHETAWKRRGAGRQRGGWGGVCPKGTWSPRGGPHVGGGAWGGGFVANAIREEGREGSGGQAASRAQVQTFIGPAKEAAPALEERSAGPRLLHRSVDPAPRGRGDPQAVRRSLRPISRVANPECPGMECAEARTTCPRARRAGHRPVAPGGLAAYKKKREERVVALFCRTKAASCCNRWFVERGRHAGRRRFNTAGIVEIDSRSSRPSPYRPGVGDWVCTSTSSITTLPRTISRCLSKAFCGGCNARSPWSWTVGRCIVPAHNGFCDV